MAQFGTQEDKGSATLGARRGFVAPTRVRQNNWRSARVNSFLAHPDPSLKTRQDEAV